MGWEIDAISLDRLQHCLDDLVVRYSVCAVLSSEARNNRHEPSERRNRWVLVNKVSGNVPGVQFRGLTKRVENGVAYPCGLQTELQSENVYQNQERPP